MFSSDHPVSEATLRVATETLHHRGPDGRRHWISPSRRVGLGHARLSIIDLATGDQPHASEDGAVRAVVNGELYDFQRIRGELEARGHRFATRSDSEILVHLYEDRGASCLHELRGEFAFVLWDETSQTLFAARDRFGIKPLYYARHNGTLYLASEVKALFAAGVPARWDHESMFQFNNFQTFQQDRTSFEGVHQVPPGHFLWATRNHIQLVRYWDFDYPTVAETALERRDDVQQIEELRTVLDEAVRLRLHADVPVGCYLSGGLDSCAVLGLASRHLSQPIKAFTLSFDHVDYDELPIAQEMAAHAGADLQPIAIRHEQLADAFADAIWHTEAPFFNTHGIAKFLLSRAVQRAGFKVVLTGEGSDEIVAGYPHFRRDLVLHGERAAGAQDVEQLLARLQDGNKVSSGVLLPHGKTRGLDGVRRVLGFVPSWMEAFSTLAAKVTPLLSRTFVRDHAGRDPLRGIVDTLDVRGQLTGRDAVHQAMYTWSKTFLPNYILNILGDRMEMAHSIEGRVPFLDHRVVELARSLPVSIKIRDMTEKYVLREAVRPVLTDTVYRRQKHPFLAPPAALNPKGRMNQLLQDTLRGSRLAALPFYDQKQVVALLDQLPGMDMVSQSALDNVFTGILSTCMLQERFGLSG